MDQNDALGGQGGEQENPQGEPVNNNQSMETLLENEEFSIEIPQAGEIRQGTIASIAPSQILVSVGAKSEGIISGRELEVIDPEDLDGFEVGQEISVFIVSPEDSNGNVVLSFKRAQEQMAWSSVEEQLESDDIIESKILGYNKGGLIVGIQGLRGFVPASQIGIVRRGQAVGDTPEQRWGKMVGEPISVRIIEVDRSRRRLILSERAASSESRQSIKERVIEELEEGQVHKGRVTSLADFGAFVNIKGADGLVHLSELSWDRIQHPNEVLEVGEEVEVKVINIDQERKRIGLSLRALSDDPWRARVEKFSVGQLVEGVITRLTKFGAFARLEGDIEGLIHISEISDTRIEHPKEELKEGEVVALRVIRIDPEQHRIGLSVRKVDSAAFADKDFKLLAKEYEQQEEETEEPAAVKEPKSEEEKQDASESVDEEPPTEAPVAEPATEDDSKAEQPAEESDEPVGDEPKAEQAVDPPADEPESEHPADDSPVEKEKKSETKSEAGEPADEESVPDSEQEPEQPEDPPDKPEA